MPYTLYATSSNGRVAVGGSISPAYALDVTLAPGTTTAARLRANTQHLRLYDQGTSTDEWAISGSNVQFDITSLTGGSTTQRLIITRNGLNTFVGIGRSAPAYGLHLGTYASTAAKPGGGTWSDPSDQRLKTGVENLTNALGTLTKLRGVTFEWINDHDHGAGRFAGVIAQEVAETFPRWVDAVAPSDDDRYLVNEGEKILSVHFPHEFNAYVIEAFKELVTQNSEFSARTDRLEKEVWELKELVCASHPTAAVCNR